MRPDPDALNDRRILRFVNRDFLNRLTPSRVTGANVKG
jgi:hypothetical protein